MPRTRASEAIDDCVTIRIRRLSKRSAMTPPHVPASSIGTNCRPAVAPSATALPVSLSTSHACATDCIHVPDTEMAWPKKYRR